MRYAVAITLLCALSSVASAQQVSPSEYGTPAELKGLTRVFVSTGSDLKLRGEILRELEKKKASEMGVKVVDRYDDAEIVLALGTDYDGNFTKARGYVSRPVPGGSRLLMDFSSSRALKWGKSNAGRFVERFLKEYKKANAAAAHSRQPVRSILV